MLRLLMLPLRRRILLLGFALAPLAIVFACEKVPLLAPTGSTITLTTTATALSANGTAPVVAQVLEASGFPPHSGTHVTFVTTLGQLQPSEGETDVNGQVTRRSRRRIERNGNDHGVLRRGDHRTSRRVEDLRRDRCRRPRLSERESSHRSRERRIEHRHCARAGH